MCGMFVERAATKDQSVVAVNNETNEVEGCIINEDWKDDVPADYKTLPIAWVLSLFLLVYFHTIIFMFFKIFLSFAVCNYFWVIIHFITIVFNTF